MSFAAAIDSLFLSPHMSAPALYRASGNGAGLAVRVIRQAPDEMGEFSGVRHAQETMLIDVRVSEVSAPKKGDTFEIAGETFKALGAPRRDAERLVWRIEAVAA